MIQVMSPHCSGRYCQVKLSGKSMMECHTFPMKPKNIYSGHRYPKEIISHVVWLYHRFTLSFRDVVDVLVQKRNDKKAAKRFFKKLLKKQGRVPYELITDKMRSYGSAKGEVMPSVTHGQVNNLFNLGRHLMRVKNYRIFRERALNEWTVISCV